ncbi:MAG: hypothetical protein ABIM50_02555 [Novosphingobium sp.]
MHKLLGIALLALSMSIAAQAEPVPAPAPAAGHYTTAATDIGTLLDDPAAKAIVAKYAPAIASNPQIEMARGMTLKTVQGYAGDTLSDGVLAKIDADLARLPAKH